MLIYRQGGAVEELGIREGFYDLAQSLADYFGAPEYPRGLSMF